MSDTVLSLRKATKLYAGVPTSTCAAARSMRWSARTAPASRR